MQGSGWAPLHLAARTLSFKRILYARQLMPQFLTAVNGRTKAAGILIKAGAELNRTSEDGRTPLFCATQNGHKAMIELLCEKGADVGPVPLLRSEC